MLLDPLSREALAFPHLPVSQDPRAAYGTAHMYLDNRGRAVITAIDHRWVVGHTGSADSPAFGAPINYDLSSVVPPSESVQSVMPDWQGRLWFATHQKGIVGVLDLATLSVATLPLNEGIGKSFAIASDAA